MNTVTDPSLLSPEQREMIAAAARNRGKLQVCVRAETHGPAVCGKTEKFFDPDDRDVAARYIERLRELERLLLMGQAERRGVYELTNFGWLISRKLRQQKPSPSPRQ
jgi:hypothetical protein